MLKIDRKNVPTFEIIILCLAGTPGPFVILIIFNRDRRTVLLGLFFSIFLFHPHRAGGSLLSKGVVYQRCGRLGTVVPLFSRILTVFECKFATEKLWEAALQITKIGCACFSG